MLRYPIAPAELERTKNQMMADQAEYIANRYAASSYKKIGNYPCHCSPLQQHYYQTKY